MSKKDEALKMALEALDGLEALLLSMGLTHLIVYGDAERAITAIREALAEQSAQQEPVAWDNCRSEKQCRNWCGNLACGSHWNDTSPLQRTWVGLTEEDKHAIEIEAAENDFTDLGVILATEAKLKEKNT